MKKLKETPEWLRKFRRIYTYVCGSALLTMLVAWDVPIDVQNKILIVSGVIGGLIQLWCDMSYKKEKLENLKPDLKN